MGGGTGVISRICRAQHHPRTERVEAVEQRSERENIVVGLQHGVPTFSQVVTLISYSK